MKRALAFFASIACLVLGAGCGTPAVYPSHDQTVRRQVVSSNPNRALPDRVEEPEGPVDRPQDRESTDDENKRVAALYRELGDKQAAGGELQKAEASLEKAHDLDPTDATCLAGLGRLFADSGKQADDADARIRFWQQACESWKGAAKLETDEATRQDYRLEAATALYSYASELAQAGRKEDALVPLYDARQFAPPGSDVARAVDEFLQQLRP